MSSVVRSSATAVSFLLRHQQSLLRRSRFVALALADRKIARPLYADPDLVPARGRGLSWDVAQHVAAAEVRNDFSQRLRGILRSLKSAASALHGLIERPIALFPHPPSRLRARRPEATTGSAVAGRGPQHGMEHRIGPSG